ncbi:MAG: inositol monophosphatase, partial [Chloroflexi bacterium]|nr:inositol monophosphatase [Chloroflexota bacterium]
MDERRTVAQTVRDLPVSLESVREWVAEAGRMALERREAVHALLKADGTPVTPVDKAVEAYLVERITQCCPDHTIIAEEERAHRGSSSYAWVIDPLDGTRAYAGGLPMWGISVGLLWGSEPVAGVFSMPALGEMYWADAQGAWRNGQALGQARSVTLADPLAYLLVPSNVHLAYEISFPRVRSLGSTAAHLLYVACTTAIGALTRRVYLWDVAGVLPILNHCGVTVAHLSGAPLNLAALLDAPRLPEPLLVA